MPTGYDTLWLRRTGADCFVAEAIQIHCVRLFEKERPVKTMLSITLGLLAACVLLSATAQPAAGQSTRPAVAATTPAATQPAGGKIEPLPDEKGKPFAVVRKVAKAPALDGKLDEGWGEPSLTGLFDEDTGKPVKGDVQTQVWLRYDEQNLYLVARMAEPAMDELQAVVTDRDGDVWQDDDLEIFLDPARKASLEDYVQIAVNPLGTVADQKGAPDVTGDAAWDCKGCTVKTSKGKDYWMVEMAIPFKALGVAGPVSGKHWGANFARDRKAGIGENSSWANIGSDWHQPDQFGHIAFE